MAILNSCETLCVCVCVCLSVCVSKHASVSAHLQTLRPCLCKLGLFGESGQSRSKGYLPRGLAPWEEPEIWKWVLYRDTLKSEEEGHEHQYAWLGSASGPKDCSIDCRGKSSRWGTGLCDCRKLLRKGHRASKYYRNMSSTIATSCGDMKSLQHRFCSKLPWSQLRQWGLQDYTTMTGGSIRSGVQVAVR